MRILSLDTSGKIASCALMEDGRLLAFEARDAMLDHSRTLLLLCQQLLDGCGVGLGQIDLFAAVIGPGSFTGVRIGVAAVKGFGWTQGRPCAGVSTLLAMACEAGGDGVLCCRLRARPEEYYYAFFEKTGGQVARLTEDAVGAAGRIEAECAARPGCRVVTDAQSARGAALAAACLAEAGRLTDCHALAPSYLKRPQAERERAARLGEPDAP